MSRSRTGRAGTSLAELLVAAALFALVLLALARLATAQGRAVAAGRTWVRAADAVRTTDLVLDGELRHLAAPDFRVARDSVRLRAVRGGGVICSAAADVIQVGYHGIRLPDPTKDSVLIVTAAGTSGSARRVLAASRDTTCGTGGYRLRLEGGPGAVPDPGLALVFETGSYHLTGGALRYRIGRGGRQPVTEAILAEGGFERSGGWVRARLVLHADSVPGTRRRPVGARARVLNIRWSP